jgi:hypothetical protein
VGQDWRIAEGGLRRNKALNIQLLAPVARDIRVVRRRAITAGTPAHAAVSSQISAILA